MRTLTRRTVAIVVTVLALLGVGIAYAAWTATGTGNATATAITAEELKVTGYDAKGLYPTGSVEVVFTVENPNPYAVTLTSVRGDNFKADPKHEKCNVESLSAKEQGLKEPRIGPGETSEKLLVTVSMDNSANDECQGATFTFDITVSGASSG